ncbi:MAG TPA: hydrogenase maturation protease [Candidatus Krumholzibacteria bacterium]|nr:hydrogenase maturation protease [Candidatus Krumholzibacteria bacterium]
MTTPKVLIVGFGNPGRGDDGLGPALAEEIERERRPDVTVEVDYQLVVEHAAMVADCSTVYFLDATVDATCDPFALQPLSPEPGLDFTSHSLSPARVLALAQDLYGARPEAWLLSVAGDRFDVFETRLSRPARRRLDAAKRCLLDRIEQGAKNPS